MVEPCYFACSATTTSATKFFLWYSDEKDGVLLEGLQIRTFPSVDAIIEYCNERGLMLSQEPVAAYDLRDIAQRIADLDGSRVDHVVLLNFWNLMDDVQQSLSEKTAISDDDLDLHEKLSFSCFEESMPGYIVTEGYQPEWTPAELARLTSLLRRQLLILQTML